MELGLAGKVAVVTGSSRGLGRAIALGLASEGCRVTLNARGQERLDETARELSGRGAQVLPVLADVAEPAGVEEVVARTLERWGRVDVLVNNVGGGAAPIFSALPTSNGRKRWTPPCGHRSA